MKTLKSKMHWLYLLFGLNLFIVSGLKAQDKIVYMHSTDTFLVKIFELKESEIKYKTLDADKKQLPIIESTKNIHSVHLANGISYYFNKNLYISEEEFAKQEKYALKIDPIALPRELLSASLEYALMPGLSAELGLALSGLVRIKNDFLTEYTYTGGFVRLGLKFYHSKDLKTAKNTSKHGFDGSYIKPELLYLSQQSNSFFDNDIGFYRADIKGVAAFVNFGKQWVVKEYYVVDYFFGVGFGTKQIDSKIGNSSIPEYSISPTKTHFNGFVLLTEQASSPAIAFQLGLKIGMLFGKPNN